MAYENIKFRKDFFTMDNGYFYFIDDSLNVLLEKTCDGNTSYIYPIAVPLTIDSIEYLQFDNVNFWSLENDISDNVIIKNWYIEDFFLKFSDEFKITEGSGYSFSVDSFILEYYTTTLSSGISAGDSQFSINSNGDRLESGIEISIHTDLTNFEKITVTGTLDNNLTFGTNFFFENDYSEGTPVSFVKNIWFINKFTTVDIDSSIFKYTFPQKELINVMEDVDFEDVTSSCFYLDDDNTPFMLMAIGTNIRFFNLDTLIVEETMTVDNIKNDLITVIPITAMHVENKTLYRLQDQVNYFESDYTFTDGSFNYQVSPINPFIDSVSIDAYPKILPSNGINVATVKMIVSDQYANALKFTPVIFDDSDSVGFMTLTSTFTNNEGVATSYYKAGVIPSVVDIFGVSGQYS